MIRFQMIEDGAAIVHKGGVWRQVKIFHRGGDLYAAHGAGFVRLYRGGGSSLANVTWKEIDPASGHIDEASYGLRWVEGPSISVAAE